MSITANVINDALANTLKRPEMVVVAMQNDAAIVHNNASGRDYVCPFGNDEIGPFIRVKCDIVRLQTLNAESHR